MQNSLATLCVYCGSRNGTHPEFEDLAVNLGTILAARGVRLVYGGGSIGLMGLIARTVIGCGGQVTGIIPEHLDRDEIAFQEASELIIVNSMHERKRRMFDLADAFAVLPGGIGTLDEMIEAISWRQLKLHRKPILLVNEKNYWSPFLSLLDHVIESGFADPEITGYFHVVERVEDVLGVASQMLGGPEPSSSELL